MTASNELRNLALDLDAFSYVVLRIREYCSKGPEREEKKLQSSMFKESYHYYLFIYFWDYVPIDQCFSIMSYCPAMSPPAGQTFLSMVNVFIHLYKNTV